MGVLRAQHIPTQDRVLRRRILAPCRHLQPRDDCFPWRNRARSHDDATEAQVKR